MGEGAGALERLITELSATFINLPAEAIDGRIEQAMGLIAEFARADRVTVGQLQEGGRTFSRTHQWVREGFQRIEGEEPVKPYPWASRRVFVDREPLVLSRLDDLPPEAARDRRSFERLGVKSVVTFPLVVGKSAVGALSFATLGHERDWPGDLVERLRVVSNIVASALARKRAQLTLGRALAFERLIAALSATFIDLPAAAVDDYITDSLERVAGFLDLDRSHVAQLSADSGDLRITHQWVRDERWRTPAVIPGEVVPWVTEQLLRGEPVIFSRPDELPAEAVREREFIELHGPKSSAILPLAAGGAVIGGVAFGAIRQERAWAVDVIDRLQLVAQIIASALARKRADQELRAALAENERLRERLEAENVYLQAEVKSARDVEEIVGRSAAIRAVLHKVDQVAGTDAPVLLLGETGTGKELIAHAIHTGSGRRDHALIAVNCAALPPTLIESELFGHEKGAFTGATHARPGRFELADGSTLFLDEIGDLELALQSKLLRALQGGEIQRLGSSRTSKANVRIIASTNRDLEGAMQEGRFRADLYYRLGVFPIEVPPLRERREDIPLLVWHFIQSRQRSLGRLVKQIAPGGMDALVAYDWPGNVRELQNVIERSLILSNGPTLRLDEAFGAARPARGARGAHADSLRDTERAHIVGVLERCRWTIEGRGQAADRLGLRPSTLRNRMRKLGIRRAPPR